MMNRFSVELESAAPLLPAASQVQATGFPVVSRIGGRIHRAGGPVIAAVHVPIVIHVVPVMRETKADLAGAIAVGVRSSHWGARMRVRVTEAVAVGRRREMT